MTDKIAYVLHLTVLDVYERKTESSVLVDGKWEKIQHSTGEWFVRLSPGFSIYLGAEKPELAGKRLRGKLLLEEME